EIDGRFFESGSYPATLLEPTHTIFNEMASAVGRLVELQRPAFVGFAFIVSLRDDRPYTVAAQPRTNPRRAIGLISGYALRPRPWTAPSLRDVDSIHDFFETFRFVALTRGDLDRQGNAVAVSNQ